MAVKSTIKNKVISKSSSASRTPLRSSAPVRRESAPIRPSRSEESPKGEGALSAAPRTKKVCFFCTSKTEPTYTDTIALRKFMSDRAKIVTKLRTGACSKHQRRITKEIKHARHLAMMPFVAKV